MKQTNREKRLRTRQKDYEILIERVRREDINKVDGYHKPGSMKS